MTVSEQLTKLAARAKEAEDNAAAAKARNKAALEQELKTARESPRPKPRNCASRQTLARRVSPTGGTRCRRTGTSTSPPSKRTWRGKKLRSTTPKRSTMPTTPK